MKTIIPITDEINYDQWLSVWEVSTEAQLSDAVNENTWKNLCDPDVPLFGFIAFDDGGKPVGLLHYALHVTSGAIEPAVYMQDLFVLTDYRRRGYARALMKAFLTRGQTEQWDRAIWLVQDDNQAADSLYDEFATKLQFNFYIHGIAMLKRLMN